MNLIPAIKLIKISEGLKLKAYRDSVGVWTIGYGTTKNVYENQEITPDQADHLLYDDIKNDRVPVLKMHISVPITNNMLCALISFTYNVGNGAFIKSTLLRRLNANEPKAKVATEFAKWNKAGDKILPGLVSRRRAERELFLKPDELV